MMQRYAIGEHGLVPSDKGLAVLYADVERMIITDEDRANISLAVMVLQKQVAVKDMRQYAIDTLAAIMERTK